jgi:hypothetical protein
MLYVLANTQSFSTDQPEQSFTSIEEMDSVHQHGKVNRETKKQGEE